MTHQQGEMPQIKDELDYLTIEEVAKELNRASRQTVNRLLAKDPSFPHGVTVSHLRGKRWVRGDIDAWKRAQVEKTRRENAQRLQHLQPKQEVRRGK